MTATNPQPYRTSLHDGRGWVLKQDADRVRAERDRFRGTLEEVDREAREAWLAERPPLERPDPCEYEEDPRATRPAS